VTERVEGKGAVMTGADSGTGRAFASSLAREGASDGELVLV
jgi:NAD(P)-dependent dehydrogenase (short-subunit alcohol dehydrogenase family)